MHKKHSVFVCLFGANQFADFTLQLDVVGDRELIDAANISKPLTFTDFSGLTQTNFLSAVSTTGGFEFLAHFDLTRLAVSVDAPAGDFNLDGQLNVADIDLLCAAVHEQKGTAHYDINGDGSIDLADQLAWIQDVRGTFLGDADLNGSVEFADFLALSAAFGQNGGWEQGNFDCNGRVAFSDFLLLSANFGETGGRVVANVPEPQSLAMLLTVLCLLLARGRIFTTPKRHTAHA